VIAVWRVKEPESAAREVLGNHRCVSTVDSRGRTIFVADAHHDDGKRFVVRADEKLTAFVELESAIRSKTAIATRHSALN
jgi:hypothetical protein